MFLICVYEMLQAYSYVTNLDEGIKFVCNKNLFKLVFNGLFKWHLSANDTASIC